MKITVKTDEQEYTQVTSLQEGSDTILQINTKTHLRPASC